MALGGRGVISVIANVAPAPTARMVHTWLRGDIETACRLQLELLPAIAALFAESNPVPVKAAVSWLGFDVGSPRPPLTDVDPAIFERLVAALRDIGVEPRV